MPLALAYKQTATVPLEVEGVTPDRLREMSLDEIRSFEIFHGNNQVPLGEFFDVSGDAADCHHVWQGDLSGVHWIGAKMTDGTIQVESNAGRHLGSQMRGGTIEVGGNAGDWVGAEMRGGVIRVAGRAGHLVGAAYRGSARGMRGGTILIRGDAGNEVGHTLRRGTIAIGGNCGDLAGFNMLAGSILLFGSTGIRHGAGMKRGTLAFFGEDSPTLLPTFVRSCRYEPDIMALVFRYLEENGFDVPPRLKTTSFDIYHGDMIEGGRGEVLIAV